MSLDDHPELQGSKISSPKKKRFTFGKALRTVEALVLVGVLGYLGYTGYKAYQKYQEIVNLPKQTLQIVADDITWLFEHALDGLSIQEVRPPKSSVPLDLDYDSKIVLNIGTGAVTLASEYTSVETPFIPSERLILKGNGVYNGENNLMLFPVSSVNIQRTIWPITGPVIKLTPFIDMQLNQDTLLCDPLASSSVCQVYPSGTKFGYPKDDSARDQVDSYGKVLLNFQSVVKKDQLVLNPETGKYELKSVWTEIPVINILSSKESHSRNFYFQPSGADLAVIDPNKGDISAQVDALWKKKIDEYKAIVAEFHNIDLGAIPDAEKVEVKDPENPDSVKFNYILPAISAELKPGVSYTSPNSKNPYYNQTLEGEMAFLAKMYDAGFAGIDNPGEWSKDVKLEYVHYVLIEDTGHIELDGPPLDRMWFAYTDNDTFLQNVLRGIDKSWQGISDENRADVFNKLTKIAPWLSYHVSQYAASNPNKVVPPVWVGSVDADYGWQQFTGFDVPTFDMGSFVSELNQNIDSLIAREATRAQAPLVLSSSGSVCTYSLNGTQYAPNCDIQTINTTLKVCVPNGRVEGVTREIGSFTTDYTTVQVLPIGECKDMLSDLPIQTTP